jgi:hypothetical protein
MRHLRPILVAALCVAPALAAAQRGGSGPAGGVKRMEGSDPTKSRVRLPSRGDIEDFAPAAFLRDKRKKLQLADADVNALKAAESAAKERNKPVLAAYDSVRRELQTMSDSPDLGANANDGTLRRMAYSNLIGQIREQRKADRDEALAAIPADKKAQAEAMLKEQDDEFDKKIGRAGRGGN